MLPILSESSTKGNSGNFIEVYSSTPSIVRCLLLKTTQNHIVIVYQCRTLEIEL